MPRHSKHIGKKAGDGLRAGASPCGSDSLLILVPLVRLLARAAARDAVASLKSATPTSEDVNRRGPGTPDENQT